MLERPRRVVLLIDYDNLQICASRDTPGRDLQLTPVVQLAQKYGTVILARAYAEWNLSTERLAVYKAGIEPAFAPVLRTESDRSGKSLADTVMVAEGMDMLWTLSPEVVVLATSDKDLIPLVRVAKQRGAHVVVLGSDFTAIPLREMADDHITYKQLITDASGRYTTEAGAARQPAATTEPSSRRRTTRERNGREVRTAVTTTTVTSPTRTEPREPREARETREPRETRETRESRAEGEHEASATAAATSGAATPPEPVAPVAAGTPGEADGQVGSRRRRRRGSRRRSERVGQTADGAENDESSDLEGDEPSVDVDVPVVDVAPDPLDPTPIESALSAEAEAPPPEAAPTRRRRTTRRTPAAATEDATATGASDAIAPTPEVAAESVPPETAAAPEAEAEPEAEASPTEGAPARRPRRVASAARGRSRTVR